MRRFKINEYGEIIELKSGSSRRKASPSTLSSDYHRAAQTRHSQARKSSNRGKLYWLIPLFIGLGLLIAGIVSHLD